MAPGTAAARTTPARLQTVATREPPGKPLSPIAGLTRTRAENAPYLFYAGCHRLPADIAAARSSDRGKRDRAAGIALTIQIVAMRSLAADGGASSCHRRSARPLRDGANDGSARLLDRLVAAMNTGCGGTAGTRAYGQKRGNGMLLTETAASWWRLGTSGGGVAGLHGRQCRPRTCVSPAGLLPSDHRTNCRDGDLLEC